MICRGGKSTGKYRDNFNLRSEDQSENNVNLDKLEWKYNNASKKPSDKEDFVNCNVVWICRTRLEDSRGC